MQDLELNFLADSTYGKSPHDIRLQSKRDQNAAVCALRAANTQEGCKFCKGAGAINSRAQQCWYYECYLRPSSSMNTGVGVIVMDSALEVLT